MRAGLIDHCVSGNVFFTGCVLISVAVWHFVPGRQRNRAAWWCLGLGWGAVGLSATPMPGFLVLLWLGLTGYCLHHTRVSTSQPQPTPRKHRLRVWLALLLTAALAGQESRYRFWPQVVPPVQHIVVLGDSLSAGIEDRDGTLWPDLLAKRSGIQVLNHSQAGATSASTVQRLEAQPIPQSGSLVIIELGGNDLLSGVPAREFEQNLERLLRSLVPLHQVLMFELPLPPGSNAYGGAQRRLARKYGIGLIPKGVLADVLLDPSQTLDSLHLNPAGHTALANRVDQILRSSPGTR